MRRVLIFGAVLVLFTVPVVAKDGEGAISGYNFNVGVGRVDITPAEEVTLAGSPSPTKTSTVDTPLFVKALVVSNGEQMVAIVTLDHLKYPTGLADRARKHIEATTGISAGNIIICASHSHSGPLWPYYSDKLITPIGQAVALAVDNLEPCKLGTATGIVDGVSRNRRLLKDGEAWNIWLLKPSERDKYPPAGPVDPEVGVLAAVGQDGKYKAILYNYACHPDTTRSDLISADYPGHVQRVVEERLGYAVPTLFLLGPCGDINPSHNDWSDVFGEKVGEEILESLGRVEFIAKPILCVESREKQLPGRENSEFNEEEISLKWPAQLEHYRKAFKEMRRVERPTYKAVFIGLRIGDDFSIITNPVELFCETGLNIKENSPFKMTMVSTLTDGACGYVPPIEASKAGGYEAWYGEHSYLSINAAHIIEAESLDILEQLENKNKGIVASIASSADGSSGL